MRSLWERFDMAPSLPSIHDDTVPPLEQGGVIARRGFTFQDHVAVRFCLQMLFNPDILEVRCESQDDITLIMNDAVEYIQVKANELDQLWTIALLCKRKKKKGQPATVGTSIYEKSLANDRVSEISRFRIVTCWPVNDELKLLTYPLSSPARTEEEHKNLSQSIEDKANGFKSKKKNGSLYWVSNALWEIEHSTNSLEVQNIGQLHKYIEETGMYMTLDKVKQLYKQLLQLVQEAADTRWEVDPQRKKVKRHSFILQLKEMVAEAQKSSLTRIGKTMQEKMEKAALPLDYIMAAHEVRKSYRREMLQPQYLDVEEREWLESEVAANLHDLLVQLDTGDLPDVGIEFYSICLNKLKEIQESPPITTKPSLSFLQGYMYYITGRCSHRFRRAST